MIDLRFSISKITPLIIFGSYIHIMELTSNEGLKPLTECTKDLNEGGSNNIQIYQKAYPLIPITEDSKLLIGCQMKHEVDLQEFQRIYKINKQRLSNYGAIIFCEKKQIETMDGQKEVDGQIEQKEIEQIEYVAKAVWKDHESEIKMTKEAESLGLGPRLIDVVDCTVRNILDNTCWKSQVFVIEKLPNFIYSNDINSLVKDAVGNMLNQYLNNPSHIVHRDINMNNMMLTADNKALLIDWGQSRHISHREYRNLLRLREVMKCVKSFELNEHLALRKSLAEHKIIVATYKKRRLIKSVKPSDKCKNVSETYDMVKTFLESL